MKSLFIYLVAAAGLLAVSQAYVVMMWENKDCTGKSWRRNVWDNTCAYTDGFQSLQLLKVGGNYQQVIAYSRQACAGKQSLFACGAGRRRLTLNKCYEATRDGGESNALSSISSAADCPNW